MFVRNYDAYTIFNKIFTAGIRAGDNTTTWSDNDLYVYSITGNRVQPSKDFNGTFLKFQDWSNAYFSKIKSIENLSVSHGYQSYPNYSGLTLLPGGLNGKIKYPNIENIQDSVQPEDYNLQNPLIGVTAESSAGSNTDIVCFNPLLGETFLDDDNLWKQKVTREFKNISGNTLIIKEFGIFASTWDNIFMIARETIETPMEVADGSYFKLGWTFVCDDPWVNEETKPQIRAYNDIKISGSSIATTVIPKNSIYGLISATNREATNLGEPIENNGRYVYSGFTTEEILVSKNNSSTLIYNQFLDGITLSSENTISVTRLDAEIIEENANLKLFTLSKTTEEDTNYRGKIAWIVFGIGASSSTSDVHNYVNYIGASPLNINNDVNFLSPLNYPQANGTNGPHVFFDNPLAEGEYEYQMCYNTSSQNNAPTEFYIIKFLLGTSDGNPIYYHVPKTTTPEV